MNHPTNDSSIIVVMAKIFAPSIYMSGTFYIHFLACVFY